MTDLPYRPCAGVILMNRDGRVFVGQRIDSTLEAWQLPQGGIDPGEDAETAAVRELFEETGVTADKIELIARAPRELTYDLPEDMIGKVWKGKWRGQRQTWFLYRFLGQDGDIRIETERPEFRAWRWIEPASLPAMIVPFKKALYEELLVVFADHFAAAGGDAAIPAGGQSA
ncbi:NUDIX domain protein [Sphingomonas sp. S17]|jgi:putative (di)nucleoside polyphosphate hydrolase|uniref:RNA pyrophosphohydrolase n=2 Tax=Sphingomonas paucimobilis TaxID=13689 RepID=A0A411LF56_SPHPI|nr:MULTISPECIES: RNA pyrophosphohydrolase [Sphingomonas]EGI56752.1 NUDIX domain protein [Sphingomonas sp. S17]MBQ1480106.1 RNA pyrophosphohydrolase [Sphingomonas sp.]MCM3678991.1 RNA pyrophosphohydrolase [Sphingomonas paucimobilis]MDG5971744.1 RNA pyrophosphohydrolase [Sphingomonas paucimobilis]NNG58243.1 RNA pyrophosphohydrolase [Sphingomonas paucimobilis]